MPKLLILLQSFLVLLCVAKSTPGAEPLPYSGNDSRLLDLPGPFITEREHVRREAASLQSSWTFRIGENPFTLKTSLKEKPLLETGLSVLSGEEERPALFQALATGTLLEGLWTTEGEVAYSLFNPESMEGLGDPERRRLRLALKGAAGDLAYGGEFRMVAKGFVDLSGTPLATGQQGGELWAQRNFGGVTVRSFVSQFSDNLEENPDLPRVTRTQGGASFGFALPYSLPYLSLSYSHGVSSTSDEPTSLLPRTGSSDNFGASLKYSRSTWDANLASNFALNNDKIRLSRSRGLPVAAPETETKNLSVSLGLVYRPPVAVDSIALSGSHTKTKSSDSPTDAETLSTSTSLNWKLGKDKQREKTLSLQATHTNQLEDAFPDNSKQDFSVRLMFRIFAR